MVIGTAVAMAASAAAGALSHKGGKQTTTTNNTSAPWSPQQPYLLSGMQDAQNAYNLDNTIGPYTGGYYSGINGMQTGAANAANAWAGGNGLDLANGMAGSAAGLYGAADPFVNNASSIESTGVGGPNAGLMSTLNGYGTGETPGAQLDPALQGAMTNAAMNGANYLGQGESNLMGVSNTALANPTQDTINNASAYAAASPVQGQINATNAMIDKTLNQQTLPGVNRDAALEGGLNSSRAGMEAAMAKDNAAVDKANADSGLFNQAYDQGLSTAASQREQGLSQAIQANSSAMWPASMSMTGTGQLLNNQNQFNTNTQLNAAQSGLDQNLNYAKTNADTALSANQQLGNAASLGNTMAVNAGNVANNDYNMAATAGGVFQNNQNALLQAKLQNWQMKTGFPYQNLQNYWSIVGKPLGQQTTGTTTGQMSESPLQGAIGGALSGASMASGMYNSGMFGGGAGASSGLLQQISPATASFMNSLK